MFGYIQPLKCELKIREYDYYRAAYCGLCNSLRTRCGIKARFIVNYDFVFLALILSYSGSGDEIISKKRCMVCPTGKKCIQSEAYDRAADVSVILTYLKLKDDMADNGFFRGIIGAGIPRLFLKKAYRRAAERLPEYNLKAGQLYDELCALEKNKVQSVDEPADKFALMLSSIIGDEEKNSRALRQIFYHIGRFIYIIDALDDFEDDATKGEYNPIASRFGIESKELSEDVAEMVVSTLRHSIDAVLSAFNLLDERENENLLRNIIELGMNTSIRRVLSEEK